MRDATPTKSAKRRDLSEMKRVRIELARAKGFPLGSSHHGYEIVAPLDPQGHIDPKAWRTSEAACVVKRFWGGEERLGRLVYEPGNDPTERWVLDYDPTTHGDDEPGFRLGDHSFVPGEYVSIETARGEEHTFKVVSVLAVQDKEGQR